MSRYPKCCHRGVNRREDLTKYTVLYVNTTACFMLGLSVKKKKSYLFLSTAPSSSWDCCPLCPTDHQMNHQHQKPNSSRDSQTDPFADLSKHRLTNTNCCSDTEANKGSVEGHRSAPFLCQFTTAVTVSRIKT